MDKTDTMIYNCFVFENYKQLQQGHSSIFLMVGWSPIPAEKKIKKFKIGEGSSLKLVK